MSHPVIHEHTCQFRIQDLPDLAGHGLQIQWCHRVRLNHDHVSFANQGTVGRITVGHKPCNRLDPPPPDQRDDHHNFQCQPRQEPKRNGQQLRPAIGQHQYRHG